MLTVAVYINQVPIILESAVRFDETKDAGGRFLYRKKDGTTLKHRYEDGAAALAIALLKPLAKEGI